jgi:protein-S-isoprenylcysteine O-methyltransferase Ste14
MAILLRSVAFVAVPAALLFGAARRWDLPFFWAYLGVLVAFLLAFLLTADPSLRQERLGKGSGDRGRHFRLILAPFILGHFLVAGLDAGRFRWSDPVALEVQGGALAGFAAAFGLILWAMAVNRFFSPAVRIQKERGHHVICAGPYRCVRHPGYLGMVIASLCSGPALGSWWAMLPIAPYTLMVIGRTALEDRFLHRHLAGYPEYAAHVRYRLLPGLW